MKTNWIIVPFLAAAAAGCEASIAGAPVSSTTITSAPVAANVVPTEQAIKDVTNVRCARELACGNIGSDGMDACTRDAREATRDVLLGQSCANGIDAAKLSTCVEDIRNERCGTAQQMPERYKSCRGMKLCL